MILAIATGHGLSSVAKLPFSVRLVSRARELVGWSRVGKRAGEGEERGGPRLLRPQSRPRPRMPAAPRHQGLRRAATSPPRRPPLRIRSRVSL
eukprot:scaffold278233_cov37-Tisochrysis_lutea.AAC.1